MPLLFVVPPSELAIHSRVASQPRKWFLDFTVATRLLPAFCWIALNESRAGPWPDGEEIVLDRVFPENPAITCDLHDAIGPFAT